MSSGNLIISLEEIIPQDSVASLVKFHSGFVLQEWTVGSLKIF